MKKHEGLKEIFIQPKATGNNDSSHTSRNTSDRKPQKPYIKMDSSNLLTENEIMGARLGGQQKKLQLKQKKFSVKNPFTVFDPLKTPEECIDQYY